MFSQSLVPGVPPAPLSISSDQYGRTSHLNLTYNLLNFGISYQQSLRAVHSSFAKYFEYEKLRQDLILDVTKQYWKAFTSYKALVRSRNVLAQASVLTDRLQNHIDDQSINTLTALSLTNDLVQAQYNLEVYQRLFNEANAELYKLLSIPAWNKLEIVFEEIEDQEFFDLDVQELEEIAMMTRPDLYKSDEEEQIAVADVRLALLNMLPGAEFYYGPQYDGNSFLLFNHWMMVGANVLWDILSLPAKQVTREIAKNKQKITVINRMALSIAALAQVNLRYLEWDNFQDELRVVSKLAQINRDLVRTARREFEEGIIDGLTLWKVELQAMQVDINYFRVYSDVHISLEELNNSIGIPGYIGN